MNKLTILFSFFVLTSLIFLGCQNNDDIISPDGDLNKPKPVVLNWGDPSPIVGEWVDLVAGQHNVVGKVYITKNGAGDITVRYTLDSDDCKITEVHVDIAKDLGIFSSTLPGGFHVNRNGNPQHGLFDKTISFGEEGTFDDVEVTFLASEIQQWLGVSSYSGKLYVAAHSEVCCPEEGSGVDEPEYCLDLSEYVKFSTNGGRYNPYRFAPVKVYDANSTYLTEFPAWCVDQGRSWVRDYVFNARFISTACETLPTDISCIIGNPNNLDLLNYLLNNFEPGNIYDNIGLVRTEEFQATIWTIMDGSYNPGTLFIPDPAVVTALYNYVAANGEGYAPDCGEKMAIIVVDADWDYCTNSYDGHQPIIIWKTIECTPQTIYGCETAYGFKYPADGTSSLFPGHVWFRYNGFNY